MTDSLLTAGSAFIEIGVFAATLVAWQRAPFARPRLAVLLGALAPLMLFYASLTLTHFFLREEAWAWGAVWIMTALPYLACLSGGVLISLLPHPAPLLARFGMGLLVPSLISLLVWTGW